MCSSHSSSGISVRSAGASLRSDPASTSRKSAVLASRAPADSRLKGESGLVGSAAFLKNFPANAWYGAATSTQASSTPAQPGGERRLVGQHLGRGGGVLDLQRS